MYKKLYPLFIAALLLAICYSQAQAADVPHSQPMEPPKALHVVAKLVAITPDEDGATTATLTLQAPNRTFVYLSFAGPRLVESIKDGVGLKTATFWKRT